MTARPLPIPTAASQAGRHHDDQGPYFGLIDIQSNGEASWLLSDGSGRYVQLRPCEPVPTLVFIVEKRRTVGHLVIEMLSPVLKRTVRSVLGRMDIPSSPLELDVAMLLNHYPQLHDQLLNFQRTNPNTVEMVELKLLLKGCLLDPALYHGADASLDQSLYVVGNKAYIQDLLHHKVLSGLDELNECFRLGLTTEETTAAEISAFNHRFEQLARAGNLYALQEHIEPAIRSGEIEIHHDDALLAHILANGHTLTHQYLLGCIQRTRSGGSGSFGLNSSDVSLDPMYQAIRQGQLQAVRLGVMNKLFFSGLVHQGQDKSPVSHVTPLVAAVMWKQIDVVRLFLDAGSPYLDGWAHAMSLAVSSKHDEILALMRNMEKQRIALFQHHELIAPSSMGTNRLDHLSDTLQQIPNTTNHYPKAATRSVSEIANRIAGLRWNQSLHEYGHSAVITSDASTHTQAASPWSPDMLRHNSQATTPLTRHTIQPSSAQSHRMKVGRDLVNRLGSQCERLRSSLAAKSWKTSDIMDSFSSLEGVWQKGLHCAELLLRNRIPSNVIDVVQLLLVADTLNSDTAVGPLGGDHRDHDKWRATISTHEQPLFEELVRLAFGNPSGLRWPPSSDIDELCRVQELAQNVVAVCPERSEHMKRSTFRGLRLPFIYACHQLWQTNDEHRKQYQTLTQQMPWDNGRQHFDQDPSSEWLTGDSFDLFDYIKVDAVEEEPHFARLASCNNTSEKDANWKSIEPTVVLLLGSHEFSIILQAIKRLQLPAPGGEAPPSADISGPPSAGYGPTSTALQRLEEFCSIAHSPTKGATSTSIPTTPTDGPYASLIPTMKAWMQGCLAVDDKLSQSLDPYILQRGTETRALCKDRTVIASSLSSSVPVTKPPKSLDRLRCQSLGCPKTFSNVSNRNKHMREGCAFRENPGYRCRNDGCSKTLTTKWYRSTHETTRCRYRAVVGQGSPLLQEDKMMGGMPGC